MANAPTDPNEVLAEVIADAKRLMRLAGNRSEESWEAKEGRKRSRLGGMAHD